MSEEKNGELKPSDNNKPSLGELIERLLPFKLPNIPLPQTLKNFDKAVAQLVLLGPKAVAGWHNRRASVKDAQAEAQKELIRKGAEVALNRIEVGDSGLAERALVAAYGQQIQQQENRERILEFAVAEIENDPGCSDADTEIDLDWLNDFADHASRVSNEQMQHIWGRVLAGELRQPGSFKLRTLHALSVLDGEEARLVHDHMNLVFDRTMFFSGTDANPLVDYSTLLALEAIGVIQGVGSTLELTIDVRANAPTLILLPGNFGIHVLSGRDEQYDIVGVCALTPFGKDLYKLAKPESPMVRLPDALGKQFTREGVRVTYVNLTATAVPNSFKFREERVIER